MADREMVFMAVANARKEAQSELGALHEAIKLRARRRQEERKQREEKAGGQHKADEPMRE